MDDENEGTFPAFPVVTGHHVHDTGMSLRDWFAGQALAGAIQSYTESIPVPGMAKEDLFARRAYAIADAMLEARACTPPPTPQLRRGE